MGLKTGSIFTTNSLTQFLALFPFPYHIISGITMLHSPKSRKWTHAFQFTKIGNGLFIPVPKNWEWTFHSHSQKLGMNFSFPSPKMRNTIYHSHSPLKIWDWAEPFPLQFRKSTSHSSSALFQVSQSSCGTRPDHQ